MTFEQGVIVMAVRRFIETMGKLCGCQYQPQEADAPISPTAKRRLNRFSPVQRA